MDAGARGRGQRTAKAFLVSASEQNQPESDRRAPAEVPKQHSSPRPSQLKPIPQRDNPPRIVGDIFLQPRL